MYSVSQLANLLDLSTYTLRYYEREQIVKPDRNSQGNRVYSDLHLQWLQFVLKLKEAQMPIVQIKKYAQYVLEGGHTAEARQGRYTDYLSGNGSIRLQRSLPTTSEIFRPLCSEVS
ncbi:MerR family transcriptional regulator [Paenibacillus sp. S3N08]|uniref:MerR family transcriptional regulator n=1 Tax=Paenibacillus agricola TaxID=2716264 RepID=A0ABX0J9S0_9BACL|nr:MerR family transcriptional regulator [Paenibacillus agricola]NHN32693.1 MerR family transcriptional regulator [Paenibacillus agricola]